MPSNGHDSNWNFDFSGTPVPHSFRPVIRYLIRAIFCLENASRESAPPIVRAQLTAFALHAGQSFIESLEAHVEETQRQGGDVTIASASLPHTALIEDMRNHDIHGEPLPVCDPNEIGNVVMSRRGNPVRLTSSGGAGIQMRFDGPKPIVTKSEEDGGKASLKPGITISYSWQNGTLFVWDHRTAQVCAVLDVIRGFVAAAHCVVAQEAARLGVVLEEVGTPSTTP